MWKSTHTETTHSLKTQLSWQQKYPQIEILTFCLIFYSKQRKGICLFKLREMEIRFRLIFVMWNNTIDAGFGATRGRIWSIYMKDIYKNKISKEKGGKTWEKCGEMVPRAVRRTAGQLSPVPKRSNFLKPTRKVTKANHSVTSYYFLLKLHFDFRHCLDILC